jgi:hypothetical protein
MFQSAYEGETRAKRLSVAGNVKNFEGHACAVFKSQMSRDIRTQGQCALYVLRLYAL